MGITKNIPLYSPLPQTFSLGTVLLRFVAHAPLNDHAPLLEYRRKEVNRNIYNIGTTGAETVDCLRSFSNIGTPTCSIKSQNAFFPL